MLFIKFILVGILNTLFGYGVWALLMYIGLHYAIATVLSTILAILFNFKTTGVLVFQNKNNKLFWKFMQIYILTMCLSILGLKCAKIAGINLYLAGLFLTGIMAIISFLMQRYYVFKGNSNEKN